MCYLQYWIDFVSAPLPVNPGYLVCAFLAAFFALFALSIRLP